MSDRRIAKRNVARAARRAPVAASPAAPPAGDRWRPWLLGAMAALWVARPLGASESAVLGDGLPVVMLWLALAVVWLLGTIVRRSWALRFAWTDAAVVLLVGLYAVSGLWAVFHGSPRPALNMLWEWVGFGLAFFMARQLMTGPRETRAVLAVMVALAVALAGYGLYQYRFELPATRAEYRVNPDQALRANGLWYPPGSRERWLFEQRLASPEPLATFALTNSLGAFLAPWLIVTLGIACWPRQKRGTLVAVLLLAVPIAVCLALTKSRSSLIAAGVGLALLLYGARAGTTLARSASEGRSPFRFPRLRFGLVWRIIASRRFGWKLPAAVGGAVLLAMVIAAAGGGASRMLSLASKSLGYRLQYWQSSLAMIADHPWLGVGPGQFQNAYTAYMLPTASEEIADPHNFLIEVWATAGTPALAALLAMLVAFGWTVTRSAHGSRHTPCAEADGTPRVPATQGDHPRLVYLGACCGFLLALPLGLMSEAGPRYAVLWLGLPLAAVAMALLDRWVIAGPLSPVLPAIGASVLLVNLLGAGGIAAAGVGGTLWLLMAVGLNVAGSGERLVRKPVGLILLVLAFLLGAACYQTSYAPVLESQAEIRIAKEGLTPQAREDHLKAATKADRLSAQPWRELAALAMLRWQQEPSNAVYDDYETYRQDAAQLDPKSAPMWLVFGDDELAVYEKKPRHDPLELAVQCYRRAAELYPNSATCHAKLALACQMAGDREAFRRQRDRALELDRLTPHVDKKLSAELRQRLLRN